MTWFRRILALFLVPFFILFFLLVLLGLRVNATLGSPQFYIAQLRQADVYNFLYDDLAPAALEEAKIEPPAGGPMLDIPKLKAQGLAIARQTLPPDWLQAQVEQGLTKFLPYALGDTQALTITIPLKDRAQAAGQALKDNLLTAEGFRSLYDPMLSYMADQALGYQDQLPYELPLNRQEIESAIRTVVPAEWLRGQLTLAIDEVLPYLTGEREHFSLRIEVKDRVEAAGSVLVGLLGKPETYDFLLQGVVAPAIGERVGSVALPLGLTLTQGEVVAAVKAALPREWFQQRLEDLVRQTVGYLEGRSPTWAVEVPLAGPKAAVIEALQGLADRKLKGLLDSLPQCNPTQLQDLMAGRFSGALPPCRPAGVSYEELQRALGIDMGAAVGSLLGEQVPDRWTFTEADLRRALGAENWRTLTALRERVSQGLTLTDADLRRALGSEAVARLDQGRSRVSQGFTFTEKDLREQMERQGDGQGWEGLERGRRWLGLARRWRLIAWALPGLFLAGIAFLGGRGWKGRVAWAAAVLGVGAGIAYLLSGPAYSQVARPELEALLARATGEAQGAGAIALERAGLLLKGMADSFSSGLRWQALFALLLSAGGLALALLWRRSPRQGQG